jgi:uncharacterized protein
MDDYTRSRFIQAVDKFNEEDYFECHEILEDIWFDTHDDSKDFYQGLLHIAVGLYHLTKKNNPNGFALQFEKAVIRLSSYPANYNGIDAAKLLKEVEVINKNPDNYKLSGLPKIVLL